MFVWDLLFSIMGPCFCVLWMNKLLVIHVVLLVAVIHCVIYLQEQEILIMQGQFLRNHASFKWYKDYLVMIKLLSTRQSVSLH